MGIYIVISIFSILFSFVCTRSLSMCKGRVLQGKDVYLIIMAIICILCMGLRNKSVGSDTLLYIRNFLRIGSYSNLTTAFRLESNSMPIYIILCRLIYKISDDPQFHIFVEALLINVCFFKFVRKTSLNCGLSTFLYFGLTLMYFGMNGARQTLSMVICANAIVILTKNIKDIKGWIIFAIAAGIHIISLISAAMIVGIIVYSKKMDKKIVTSVFAGVGAVTGSILLVLSNIFSGYFTHYKIYFNGYATYGMRSHEGGGRIIIVYLYLAMFIFIWLFQRRKLEKPMYDDLFSHLVPGMAFGICLGIFNAKNVLISRMVWYYVIFFIPFLPYVISRCNKTVRIVLNVGTVVAFFAYSIIFLRENQGAVVPYNFFWM